MTIDDEAREYMVGSFYLWVKLVKEAGSSREYILSRQSEVPPGFAVSRILRVGKDGKLL
jgi:hypothetical protein